jgi:Ca-activated chloride channel family protein
MQFSSINEAKKIKPSLTVRLRQLPLWTRCAVLVFIIISLARPQKGIEHITVPTEGIDIILALDVSTSMLAEDFTLNGKRANRLAAVKPIVKDFIEGRINDQIGIVIFAGRPYTQCPLTLDYGILFQFLNDIEIGMVEDGTAIGSAIATCINRLKNIEGKSKIIILLTDGRNNTGKIDPLTAAEMAKSFGIKIYTIGAGTKGMAPYPVMDPFGNKVYTRLSVDIDEDTLKKIADITGGEYFRATDTAGLKEIYKQIDQMEKRKSETKIYMEYKELFPYFLIPGLALLLLEIVISNTWLKKLP